MPSISVVARGQTTLRMRFMPGIRGPRGFTDWSEITNKPTTFPPSAHQHPASDITGLTKASVGLGNVDNTSDANKPISTATATALAGKSDTGHTHSAATTGAAGFMSAADKSKLDGIASGAQVNTVASVAGKTGAVTLVKGDVGLGNVDNTSDANKPVSTAQAEADATKVSKSGDTMTGPLTIAVADGPAQLLVSGTSKALRLRMVSDAAAIDATDQTGAGSYQPLVLNGSNLRFTASDVEQMRLTSSGSLGIGVTDPQFGLGPEWKVIAAKGTAGGFFRSIGGSTNFDLFCSEGQAIIRASGATPILFFTDGTERLSIGPAGNVLFGGDGTQNLGGPSNRGNTAYFTTGAINTSDAREKTSVRALLAAERAAAIDLSAEIGIYQFLASIEEKGEDGARLHVGMTVQRAIEIMEGHGLDPWRYGFICRDDITRKVKVMQTETVQDTEEFEEAYSEIEVRDGIPTRVQKTRTVQRPKVAMVAVVDEAGEPVMNDDEPVLYPVPVMIEREREVEIDEPAGDRLGFRYEQLTLFILAGLVPQD